MIDNYFIINQYDFASFGMLSLLFGHPSIIHFLISFSPRSFAVSSLISSNLDCVAGAFWYTICTWDVHSPPGMLSAVSSRWAPDKISTKIFPYQARYTKSISNMRKLCKIIWNLDSVVASSLLLLVVCDRSILSLFFHICSGEIFDIQIPLLTSPAQLVHIFVALLLETLMCMQLVFYSAAG